MSSARRATAAVGVAVLGLAGCGGAQGGGTSTAGAPVDGKTFTMALPSDPGTLDPAMTVLSSATQLDRFLYDPLINLDRSGGATAGLAEKWQADTTTARFTLRRGITCADGSPLTAKDVAANIDFVGNVKNKSPLAGLYVSPGTTARADESTREIRVTSKTPDAFLLRNVGGLPIACGKGLADRASLAKGRHGTGMFTLTESVRNDHYTLTRRKDYAWGPGAWKKEVQGLPDKVRVRIIANETTSANLLLSGELNAAQVVGPDRQRLTARKQFAATSETPLGEMWFNQEPGRSGADAPVRRALAQALNLSELGTVLTSGTGKPSRGMAALAPKACPGDSASGALPEHDLAAAKSALDKAGWRVGADGVRARNGKRLTLTFGYATSIGTTAAAGAELVQKAWQSVGAKVTLKGVDNAGISQILSGAGSWDALLLPVAVGLPSQIRPFVSGPTPPDGTNFSGIANKKYESLADKAGRLTGSAGCAAWRDAEAALVGNVDVVPFVDAVIPVFGSAARFQLSLASITPSTIRMYG
ncbi:ABC transporter substrate-binding protein [Streptomyces sp. NPDC102467]|uniref:ABC transporter substrate-binding protein n=1 Tax=Streptomyces sp. NPDC102467 TaxID=3366179 RepID=UPI0038216537